MILVAKARQWAGPALVGLCLVACTGGPRKLEGPTMGTTYQLTWYGGPSSGDFAPEASRLLKKVNSQMSTYLPDSVLSRFNRNPSQDWLPVPDEVVRVVSAAQRTSVISGGAFDVTVLGLVNLWGFGPDGRRTKVPKPQDIANARPFVGYQKLSIRPSPPGLKKGHPKMTVDLSGIAKGYGVDVLAEALETRGVNRYFVEIGGEIRTRGPKPGDKPWSVGVERPTSQGRQIAQVFHIRDSAMATSGDYRNYFEHDGVRYSHTIDPRTGQPIRHRLASVTVVASTCMEADALATALMVMGEGKGMQLARDRGWAVYMLVRGGESGFEERSTSEFDRVVSKGPGISPPRKVD